MSEETQQSTAVVSWKDRLAQYATEAVATEKPAAGTAVTCKAGQLTVGGQPTAGNKLDVVVFGAIYENALYDDDYDPDNPRSPKCFAFAKTEEELAPHADSAEPQHATCKGCPHNEFGSAAKGRGKACKNIRRLAMVPATPLTAESVISGDAAYMKLPVTSVKEWAKYVNTLSSLHQRPPFAVVTQLGTVPDAKTQFKVTFHKTINVEDGDILDALMKRHDAAYDFLAVPYKPNAEKQVDKPNAEKQVDKPAKGKGKF